MHVLVPAKQAKSARADLAPIPCSFLEIKLAFIGRFLWNNFKHLHRYLLLDYFMPGVVVVVVSPFPPTSTFNVTLINWALTNWSRSNLADTAYSWCRLNLHLGCLQAEMGKTDCSWVQLLGSWSTRRHPACSTSAVSFRLTEQEKNLQAFWKAPV